jgi:predicted kinase
LELIDHGLDVILEDGLWAKRERKQKLTDARARGARAEIHVFDLTFEQLWERLEPRTENRRFGDVPITPAELERIGGLFEKPDAIELAAFDWHQIHRA